jgi:hypothetical protein
MAVLLIALAALSLSLFAIAIARALALFVPRTIGQAPRVQFDDATLIAAGLKPAFQNDEGEYQNPNLVLAGGRPTRPIPQSLPCPSTYVIYSSWAENVGNCQGFGGPNDGNNRVVAVARQNAQAVADGIECDDECNKQVREIWKGWDCFIDVIGTIARAAVEIEISCVPDA